MVANDELNLIWGHLAALGYFTFPCIYYFFTLLWLYSTILHSLVLISFLRCYGCTCLFYILFVLFLTLLQLHSAILHFLFRITLLGYYCCTWLFYISLFLLRYYIIMLLRLYSAILHLFVHVALEKLYLPAILYVSFLLHCYGCTQLFYGSLFLLHYYGSNQLFTHFLAVVTLLRCYGYTRFLILVVLIIPAELSYFISLRFLVLISLMMLHSVVYTFPHSCYIVALIYNNNQL